uniref:NADH-ubiquinone oxidoreductase chain 5 n=1 Tax=Polygyra cereolus TaxID=339438 RepID=A0A1J0MRQ1_9EUPU|nr:NADH dehydrogenase subunit 5 [Polygyra cereolus]APD28053.1 NADH dehydrogenase subunit 5 [Polygyra cereolus]
MVLQHKQRLSVLLFLSALMSFLMSIYLFKSCDCIIYWGCEFFTVSSHSLNFYWISDWVSLSFSSLVFLVSFCVFCFARWYMSEDVFYYRFMWLLLSFVISMNLLIYSGSFLSLMVGWDGLGVTSFLLIVYYESKSSMYAGFLTLLVNRLGDLFLMCLFFYFCLQGLSLLGNYQSNIILVLFTMGALTKSAQYPYSTWLPAAMAAPTPVSALVHSSTLVTAGIYILVRASMTSPLPQSMLNVLLLSGSVTTLLGGLCASTEFDIKKIIAFSTLSQLGVMVFCLGLGSTFLALMHLYMHALFKALLFMVAGCMLLLSYGVQDIRLLGSLTKRYPIFLVFLNVSFFNLIGLPFYSAFYSKHSILNLLGSSSVNFFSMVVMCLGVGLTSIYSLRFLKVLNWNQSSMVVSQVNNFPLLFYIPFIILFSGSIFLGKFFSYMNPSLYISNLTLKIWEPLIYILILSFLFWSLFFFKVGSSNILVSMFYTSFLWGSGPYLVSGFTSCKKSLECGWVEPAVYMSKFQTGLKSINQSFLLNHWFAVSYFYLSVWGFLMWFLFLRLS